MNRTHGQPRVAIGLVDGPLWLAHPDLAGQNIRRVSESAGTVCSRATSSSCRHGTFVAGILSAKRGSTAPALCSGCTLLVRPVFGEFTPENGGLPSATPEELAAAIVETVDAGARVLNLSLALVSWAQNGKHTLIQALDYAARRQVVVVAAAGNQGTLGSSAITRHPWVIPVAGCDSHARR
jgi:subtilisin family serine protease